MKNPWVLIALLVVVLVSGSVWYSNKVGATYNDGVVVTPHITGNENATITLTEYSDFECPACGQFQPMVTEILSKYGDNIKFEYKHYPLIQIHKYAQIAATAAEAAGQQGKFFEYADKLFLNQKEWTKSSNPTVLFTKYATELGLDVDKFNKQQRSSLLNDRVKADMMEARNLGLTSTPSFFLNGTKMEIKSFEDFTAQIEAAINPKVDFSLTEEARIMVPVEGGNTTSSQVSQ
jgi:protein-disulfide isomerase